MTWEQVGQYLYDHPEIYGGIAAGIGLFFTARALRHQQRQAQVRMIESVFKDIRELEKELSQIPPPTDIDDLKYGKAASDWDSRLFNTLEWLAFLINEKEVSRKKLIKFFKDSIVRWYEELFLNHMSKEVINDPKQYDELKKLYKKLKDEPD